MGSHKSGRWPGDDLDRFTFNKAIKGGLNTRNTLTIRMSGATFDCYVNGQKMGTIHDLTFDSGAWGLTTYSTLDVVYTNYSALNG